MSRIALDVFRAPHEPSLEIGYQFTAVRILTEFSLMTASGWTRYHPAVIDTGAPISMFPKHVWQDAQIETIGQWSAGGIVPRKECRIPVTFARVSILMTDGKESIGPVNIHAYLADSYEAPTLLGIAGALEENALWLNVRQNNAYLEREYTANRPTPAPR